MALIGHSSPWDPMKFAWWTSLTQKRTQNDLCAVHTWELWLQNISSFDVILMEPVCSSFSPARRHALSARDSGPRPLRSVAEPMGLKKPDPPFTSAELETMKIGNCFSRRSLLLAKAAKSADIPVALEAPRVVYADQVSMYTFPEAQDLMDLGAFTVDLDQCRFSAHSTKPTRFLVLLPSPDTQAVSAWKSVELTCNHNSGHTPLVGKLGSSEFKTSAAQVYPPELNAVLATAIVALAVHTTRPLPCDTTVKTPSGEMT